MDIRLIKEIEIIKNSINSIIDDNKNNTQLIQNLENINIKLNNISNKIEKTLERQEKILIRSDKLHKQEYDQLQKKLEEVQKLQESQRHLLDSFVKVIATAIDNKSPYTGAHCEKVPELALMLTNAADKNEKINFKIHNKDELREITLAAWLHDAGKVTTPEYVMDKATKLETIYNRIHEIRMRFEVLYRDIKIKALEKIVAGENEEEVKKWEKAEFDRLTKEWEFIAKANVGSEFMSDEDIEKIKQISSQEWVRYFDNTLGLSWAEKDRMTPSQTPTIEKLLSDKPEHIIKRDPKEFEEFKKYNFKMKMPENLYNYGEIYNLTIKKGTLTKEEYFKIQEHIIITIKMLEELPFPENLKNVPLYAGTHHEKLDGTGYPRKLTEKELPIPSRIMSIADIFEALTANDRPYKEAKKLSEAIQILYFMVKDGHLDKDLFKLFLEEKIFLQYAKKHLKPYQIDEVDINRYLKELDG